MIGLTPLAEGPSLASYFIRNSFQIADDGLTAIAHTNMLDAHELLTAATQASKDLNLGCISPHQASRGRSEGGNSTFIRKGDIQPRENGHCGCMGASHLDGKCSLNFVLGCGRFDHRERSVHGEFRNPAIRRTACSLYLVQTGAHKIARCCAESFVQPLPPICSFAIRGTYRRYLPVGRKHFDTDGRKTALTIQWRW